MDVVALAKEAVKRRFARVGRLARGEAMARELNAAGKSPGQHEAFNYPTGVKVAAELLRLLGVSTTLNHGGPHPPR